MIDSLLGVISSNVSLVIQTQTDGGQERDSGYLQPCWAVWFLKLQHRVTWVLVLGAEPLVRAQVQAQARSPAYPGSVCNKSLG